ncbi:hypothetical protein [Silvimonas sp.]|uniref:hypothetical protein n=1 Tax=Silvimonas sp. TaxID=2650811 RepID=UPI00283C16D3|nr:hypothetical protein [Silvimonas sp.]MDR3427913.1 hypothetical protein [Silvimonas sp.]
MLSALVMDRFTRLCELETQKIDDQLNQEIGKLAAEMNANGQYRSGAYIMFVQKQYANSLKTRIRATWQAMHRVINNNGEVIQGESREELKTIIRSSIDRALHDLSPRLEAATRDRPQNVSVSLVEAAQDSLQTHELEIDLYVDSVTKKQCIEVSPAEGTSYIFYGAVGAVQTGAHASASIVQNLAQEDRDQIVKAIKLVIEHVESSDQLTNTTKEETIAVANEALEEIGKEKPNNTKLRGFFDILAQTVQTVSAAPGAYTALQNALLALGISI